jgi:hypothetical protein
VYVLYVLLLDVWKSGCPGRGTISDVGKQQNGTVEEVNEILAHGRGVSRDEGEQQKETVKEAK